MSETTTLSRPPSVEVVVPLSRADRIFLAREAARNIEFQDRVDENLNILLSLFQHELLCLRLKERTGAESINEELEPAIDSDDTGYILKRIAPSVTEFRNHQYLQRLELQFRTLLCVLAVLKALKSDSIELDTHRFIEEQLKLRFKAVSTSKGTYPDVKSGSIQWNRCSYLIESTWEFYKNFSKAEREIIQILSQGLTLISIGLSIAGVAALGGNPPDLKKTLKDLNEALQPIRRQPNSRFQSLFALQELTHFVSALDRYVRTGDGPYDYDKLIEITQDLRDSILATATSNVLNNTRGRLRDSTDRFQLPRVIMQRGAPELSEFHLVYGSIDCATQVLSLQQDRLHPSASEIKFTEAMRNLARGRNGFDNLVGMWKAHDYLASLASGSKVLGSEFCETYHSTRDCMHITRRISVTSSVSSTLRPGVDLSRWIERSFHPPDLSADVTVKVIKLGGKTAHRTGLSPDCTSAFFLTFEKSLTLVNIDSGAKQVFGSSKTRTYYDAAFSTDHLAILYHDASRPDTAKHRVLIRHLKKEFDRVDFSLRDISDGNYPFFPTCISIHDYDPACQGYFERCITRVVIGARASVNDRSSASIRLFQIEWVGDQGRVGRIFWPDSLMPSLLMGVTLKSVGLGPDGSKLTCITTSDKIFAWDLGPQGLIPGSTFESPNIFFANKAGEEGITSASVFYHPLSGNPYMFITTWPSEQEEPPSGAVQADWPVVFPMPNDQTRVPKQLIQNFKFFGKKLEHQVAGAVSPDGMLAAMRDRKGCIVLIRLYSHPEGGVAGYDHVKLDEKLFQSEIVLPSSLRFRKTSNGLEFVAIDEKGKILRKSIATSPPTLVT